MTLSGCHFSGWIQRRARHLETRDTILTRQGACQLFPEWAFARLRRMKRYLSLFLLLLLSVMLPLNGMADRVTPAESCPMASHGSAMDGMQDSGCGDQQQRSGEKTCKIGQECKIGYALQVSAGKASFGPSRQAVPAFTDNFIPSLTPFGVWRPPRT